ncbi:MAG: CoA transferase [Dehalococcoidia bacterium]|nr:CoA transferase [Dehalococcoidia bacterium]
MDKGKQEAVLSGYRILDLTDDKGHYCGKVLADLGADVIKIEPPGGDPSRNIGPFYKDTPDPEKSLSWWAYNTSKRGITLNLESDQGKDIFRRLVKNADAVVESSPPGYMDRLGLGYTALSEINPDIVVTSITPFGQTGPYKDWKADDLVGWAMAGQAYVTGDDDRPPCQISFPHGYLVAGSHAASGTLAALYYRECEGEGQHVDVSMQEAVLWTTLLLVQFWDIMKINLFRAGSRRSMGTALFRLAFPCKDGHVGFLVAGGQLASITMPPLIKWMAEEGMLGAFEDKKDWGPKDWTQKVDAMALTQETVDAWENSLLNFFATKTKSEIYEKAREKSMIIYPVSTTKDLAENVQLKTRDFYVEVEHPELGETITYMGSPYKMTVDSWSIRRRAPLIGEHNKEIYDGELGLSQADMRLLKEAGVI